MTDAYWVADLDNAPYRAIRLIAASLGLHLINFEPAARVHVPLIAPPMLPAPSSIPRDSPELSHLERSVFLAAWAVRARTRAANPIVVCGIDEPTRQLADGLTGIGALGTTVAALVRSLQLPPLPLAPRRLARLLLPENASRAARILHDLSYADGEERSAILANARNELRIVETGEAVEARIREIALRGSKG